MTRMIDPEKLTTRSPFSDLFPIEANVLAAIRETMHSKGFDSSKAIDVWDNGNVVIDGHTRLTAAIDLGLKEVPIFIHSFKDEDEALEYAIRIQRDRRNITGADLYRCIEALDKRRKEGRPGKKTTSNEVVSRGPTAAKTAETVGVSKATVERARVVMDHAEPEIKQAVKTGEMSLNRAYTETQQKRKHQAEYGGNGSLVIVERGGLIFPAKVASTSAPKPAAKPAPKPSPPTFNRTNDNVEWALWTWNPVTGCEHNCIYCYARDIANRFYPEKFVPTFHPERLSAPQHMKVPAAAATNIGEKNVFVCSMADLFGRWVPAKWIDAVMEEVRKAPQWNFLFLTKFPLRYEGIDFPDNAWVGTSVDEQKRVASAEKAFRNVKAKVKWLSCEPMREKLTFTSLEMFDWVVMGGQSKSTQAPAFQPPWDWVEHLWKQARDAGCQVYWKPNLETRPREYPGMEGQ